MKSEYKYLGVKITDALKVSQNLEEKDSMCKEATQRLIHLFRECNNPDAHLQILRSLTWSKVQYTAHITSPMHKETQEKLSISWGRLLK